MPSRLLGLAVDRPKPERGMFLFISPEEYWCYAMTASSSRECCTKLISPNPDRELFDATGALRPLFLEPHLSLNSLAANRLNDTLASIYMNAMAAQDLPCACKAPAQNRADTAQMRNHGWQL